LAGASVFGLEAKAFLTADANFTHVHDSEPLIMQRLNFDGFVIELRKRLGVST
jgi:hypothetical protein